ncbi:MAG: carbohydrate-binding protein, partial [Chitinophagaceae bacterium]
VGVTEATRKIQIDRYSLKSNKGASIAFLDTANTFEGWKAIFSAANAWMQYNSVEFGNHKLKSISLRALSKTGGTIQIRLDKPDGPIIARVKIPGGNQWQIIDSPLLKFQHGKHNLIVQLKSNGNVEIDWINFK